MKAIPKRETLTVEFKSDRSRLPDDVIIDSVVAFANTEGGELYLGIEDDGRITGLHKDHRNIVALAAFIANRTVPPIAVRTELLDAEPPVLRVEVPKSRAITATTSGKILRRRLKPDGSPENLPMYPYEIPTRLSALSLLDYSAQPAPGAGLSDLDGLERERLRNSILAYHGEQMLLELGDEDLDKALRLTTEAGRERVPTITGLLLIGKAESLRRLMPTHAAAFQVLKGSEIKVNDSFVLPLLAAFEKLSDYLSAWNQERELEEGLFRISIPDFDKRAFREALVNAFCHRDYTVLGRIRLMLDEDGLTLSNPGGFIEGVTQRNLLTVEPHGRNPLLADALKRIGLAERTGRGIDRIYEGSLHYGKPLPDYSGTTTAVVSLFIPRGVPDPSFIHMLSEEQRQTGYPLPVNSLLVLNYLREARRANLREVAEAVNLPEAKVRSTLERLTESGMVEAMGGGKARSYLLSSRMYREKARTAQYVRQTDIDRIRYAELILKLTRKQGSVTRADVVELLHISPPQAHRLLQKLVSEGQLAQSGKNRGTTYRIPT